MIIAHKTAVAHPWDADGEFPPDNLFHETVLTVCREALSFTPYKLDALPITGIAMYTEYGERFPCLWHDKVVKNNQRLSPRDFPKTVFNSAAGYVSIALKLMGPMVVLNYGNMEHAAMIQLYMMRAKLMLVCMADMSGPVTCFVMEMV